MCVICTRSLSVRKICDFFLSWLFKTTAEPILPHETACTAGFTQPFWFFLCKIHLIICTNAKAVSLLGHLITFFLLHRSRLLASKLLDTAHIFSRPRATSTAWTCIPPGDCLRTTTARQTLSMFRLESWTLRFPRGTTYVGGAYMRLAIWADMS